jgi:outer membrane protein TolC
MPSQFRSAPSCWAHQFNREARNAKRVKRWKRNRCESMRSEKSLLDAQLNRVEAQRAQLTATADLFKAMGGGWNELPLVAGSAKN